MSKIKIYNNDKSDRIKYPSNWDLLSNKDLRSSYQTDFSDDMVAKTQYYNSIYNFAPNVGKSTHNNANDAFKHAFLSASFEDMMSKFKKTSEDKMSDLKRGNESRGYSRRGGRNK